MGTLRIDNRPLEYQDGETVFDVCRRNGISIPVLCRLEGHGPITSCMVCLVEDTATGELIPSCSSRAADYTDIATGTEKVHHARRAAVELLLSEHAGDCEAPCRRACPGGVDLPRMIRHLRRGETAEASAVYLERLPYPGILAAVCPAPCERICSRSRIDTPLEIRGFERLFAGPRSSGKQPGGQDRRTHGNIAVVGAGPAGLSAAYYLGNLGFSCRIFEKTGNTGGGLSGLDRLDQKLLSMAADRLTATGIRVSLNTKVESPAGVLRLAERFEAVILAAGSSGSSLPERPGVFAAGDIVRGRQTHLAARSMAEGRGAAFAAARWLKSGTKSEEKKRFDSRIGRLSRDELLMMVENKREAVVDSDGESGVAVRNEAARCMSCDCISGNSCMLREIATDLGADRKRYSPAERAVFQRETDTDDNGSVLSYEPGKCIRCGICVVISGRAKKQPGLSFSGRGTGIRIRVPFGDPLFAGMGETAMECVKACPTGSLARYKTEGSR